MTTITPAPADSPYALHGVPIAEMGYSAIPCRPGSKRPGEYSWGQWYGRNEWQQYCDRAPTEHELTAWSSWPDAGVCVALGFNGVVAVDVDTDEPQLRSALSAILPLSRVQKRGEKGFTAFYRASPAVKSAAFNVNGSRVLDLLAHGKQTVIPPTVHPDTSQPYIWLTPENLENTHPRDLPELPDDIAEQIAAALTPFGYAPQTPAQPTGEGYGHSIWREVNDAALANLDAWVPALELPKTKRTQKGYVAVPVWRPSNRGRPTHERNPNLKITRDGIKDFHDGDRGYTPLDVVVKALDCSLDYADDWLRKRIGYTEPSLYGLEPWFPAVASETLPVVAAPKHTPLAAPRGKIDPFVPANAGGLIEAISNWTMDMGRRPVPEFALMTGLAFVAGMFGRRFVGPTGAGLNVYLVGLGQSALGKGHPLKALRKLAMDCGMPWLVTGGNPTSDSALERMLRQRPCQVLPLDEFGLLLQSVNGKGASAWGATVRRALLELYSLSTDLWMGKQFSDPKRPDPLPLHCPTLSLMSVTTPSTFYDGLTEANLSDGFMNRLTVLHATELPERRKAPAIMVTPHSLREAITEMMSKTTGSGFNAAAYRDGSQEPTFKEVRWQDEAAERRWLEIEDWQIEQIEERGQEGVVGRAAEQTIKFATLRALSRDGAAAKVSVVDVEWGYALVGRSLACIDNGIENYMSGSEFEALTKAIVTALRKHKTSSMPRSVLLRQRGVSKHDDKLVNAAIERLEKLGDLKREKNGAAVCLVT